MKKNRNWHKVCKTNHNKQPIKKIKILAHPIVKTFIQMPTLISVLFISVNLSAEKLINQQIESNKTHLSQLNKSREDYQLDKTALAEISESSRDVHWLTAFQNSKKSHEKYLSKLVEVFVRLPGTDSEFQKIHEELLNQHPDRCKNHPTESYRNQLNLLANACSPHLITNKVSKEKAIIVANLLKPPGSIKFEDKMHLIGITTESQNWNIQADYSIAQLRAGNISIARNENAKLLRKAASLSKKRKGINYRKEGNERTSQSLYREYLLHRALIESHANDKEIAKKYLTQGQKIEEESKNKQNLIIQEINSLH